MQYIHQNINYSDASLKTQIKIITGDGSIGTASSPHSLTFDFAPTYIILLLRYKSNSYTTTYYVGSAPTSGSGNSAANIYMPDVTTEYSPNTFRWMIGYASSNSGSPINYCKKSSDGKTLYWYGNNDNDKSSLLCYPGDIYHWLGIA